MFLFKAMINGALKGVTRVPKNSTLNCEDGSTFKLGGVAVTASAAELNAVDTTAGTGAASKAAVLDSSGNFAMPDNGNFGFSRAAVAAAGSTAADATAMTDQFNVVTAADSAKGVALPAAAATAGPVWVINSVTSEELKVYPVNGGNDNINALAEDAAFILGPGAAAYFVPTSATQWYAEEVSGTAVQKLATEAGTGITLGTGTVYKTSVTRLGGVITTSILIDLTGLHSEATDLDIIGVDASANPAHIGQITAARNGTILGGIVRCLEVPAGGDPNIALYSAAEGTGVEDALISSLTEAIVFDPAADWTIDMSRTITGMPAANDYLYLVQGDATGTDADYTAGKFLIELYGYDA